MDRSHNNWKQLLDACTGGIHKNYRWSLHSNQCEIDVNDNFTVFTCRIKNTDNELSIQVLKKNCIESFSEIYEELLLREKNK